MTEGVICKPQTPRIASKHQKIEAARKDLLPRAIGWSMALLTLRLWTSHLQNYETINFCCFKSPSFVVLCYSPRKLISSRCVIGLKIVWILSLAHTFPFWKDCLLLASGLLHSLGFLPTPWAILLDFLLGVWGPRALPWVLCPLSFPGGAHGFTYHLYFDDPHVSLALAFLLNSILMIPTFNLASPGDVN